MGQKKKTTIGGQALIEGILMRGPSKSSIVIRKPDGQLEIKNEKIISKKNKGKFLDLPFIRGVVALVNSLVIGTDALVYSSSFYEDVEDEQSFFTDKFGDNADKIKSAILLTISFLVFGLLLFFLPQLFVVLFNKLISEKFISIIKILIRLLIIALFIVYGFKYRDIRKKINNNTEKIAIFLSILFSLGLSVLIFFLVPTLITSLFKSFVSISIVLNLIEGLIRMIIFIVYIYIISKIEDMNRVFMYHGAEHKTIHCYENGEDLNIENVKKCSMLHRRCGTSFIFTIMLISIIVLSFFGWPNPFLRLLTRIIILPVIAGISYEINRILGRSDGKIAEILSAPGLLIQKLGTVKEPTEDMIEVAIVALKEVIPEDSREDIW